MAQQRSHHYIRAMRRHTYWWTIALVVPLVVLVAACRGGGKTTAKATTPTTTAAASTATPSAATTAAPGQTLPQITPIPGNYSIYVDPAFGYSFEYPTQWIPHPSTGTAPGPDYYNGSVQESNVDIADPTYPNQQHPAVQLTVRATNNYNAQFVQHWLCNPLANTVEFKDTIDGYTGQNLSQQGGDTVNGLSAPAWGFIFPVPGKGLVVEVWLQSSAKWHADIQYFVNTQKPIFQHVLDTFSPGPGAKQIGSC